MVCAPSAGLAQLADLPRVGHLLVLQSSSCFQMWFVVMGRAETLCVGSWELPWAQAGQKALCSMPGEMLGQVGPNLWWGIAHVEGLSGFGERLQSSWWKQG